LDTRASSEEPLFRQVRFAGRDDAERFLSELTNSIADVRFSTGSEFHASYAGGSIGRCSLHRGMHSDIGFRVRSADEHLIMLPQTGGVRFESQGGEFDARAGKSVLWIPPHEEGDCQTTHDTSGVAIVIDSASFAEQAERIAGRSGAAVSSAAIPTMLDTGDPRVATLARNTLAVFGEVLALERSGLPPILAASFDDMLLGIVSGLALSFDEGSIGATASVGNGAVGAARDYIHAHAAEPVRLSSLADRLGVGLRSLQIGFRREYGMSLRDFLTARRLELARTKLMSGAPGTRVLDVALESGFADLGMFSARYQSAYGELPSTTLRRHRSRR